MATENKPAPARQGNRQLKRIAGVSAWGLLASVALMLLSGWGITQTGVIYDITFGLIDRGAANEIHRAATVALGVFFLAHVLSVIRLKLHPRRPLLRATIDGLFLIIAGLVIWLVIFMTYIRPGG